MIDLLFALTFVSALGCGLIAGVFFAFSAFVMKALVRLPPTQGIAAMQSINFVVIDQPTLHGGVPRNGIGLCRAGRLHPIQVERTECRLPARRQPALSHWHHCGDPGVQPRIIHQRCG